jgi:predicted 3-demethylubiquinone-9 3-methyltransferase (glyoxalase superfamily)
MKMKQKITPYLWFNDNAEEAVNFYVSLFGDSKILEVARYPEGAPRPKGTVMNMAFQLAGQRFIALNGGPHHQLNEAFSLFVDCDNQQEVDSLWEKLTSGGGSPSQCGWLKDRFGLSWQIIPSALVQLMSDPDPEKSQRVVQAMFTMQKIDIATLKRAHSGR